MNSGTIGDSLSSQVIEGIEEVDKISKIKNAALQYFSKKVNPNNFGHLQNLFQENDQGGNGFLTNDDFRRCMSGAQMKVTDSEV